MATLTLTDTQICSVCKEEKSLTEFHKNKNRSIGVSSTCKPCAIERTSKWQREHKEQVNEYQRRNYALNLEQARANRRIRFNKWYSNNTDKVKAASRRYAQAHPEVKRIAEHNRRIRKQHAGQYLVTKKEINKLLAQPCNNCRTSYNITIDHIIPISRGGRHSIGNLQALCFSCNASKNNRTLMEWRLSRKAAA